MFIEIGTCMRVTSIAAQYDRREFDCGMGFLKNQMTNPKFQMHRLAINRLEFERLPQ